MKQNLLKEMETGSKNALLKKRIITHYIYSGASIIYIMCNNPLFDESAFRALFYFFQELLVHNYAYLVIHTKIINFFINTWF